MKTVLVGAAGTGTSFAIISHLRANFDNIKIIATDINEESLVTSSLMVDKYYKVPYANSEHFITIIENILNAESVDIYIPILNDEIIIANKLSKKYKNIDFWSNDLYEKCIDKAFASKLLEENGVNTPLEYQYNELKEVDRFFMKPRNGFGSHGSGIKKWDDIINLNSPDNYIFQEICEYPEITVDSFYDYKTGISYSYCRERLEVKSGVCTKARLFFDPVLSEIATKIGKSIQQCGVICFQVMKSSRGWVVTDLNLRSGAGTAITCSAGFDVISAGYACRIGLPYEHFLNKLSDTEEYIITRQYSEFITKVTV